MKVLKLNNKQLTQMEKFYLDDVRANTNQYVLFQVASSSITAYTSGKVVFQGNNALKEYDMWIKMFGMEEALADQEALFFTSSIGSDEVGKGDYFGPLVVCAAYVSDYAMKYVRELRIADSKSRTDERIKTMAKEIIKHVEFSVLVLNNEKYNELSEKGFSVVKMMAILHNKAITNLKKKVHKNVDVIIDQFAEPAVYYNYVKGQPVIYRDAKFTTKAESKHSSVAVASIIARYKFLEEMDRLSKEVGLEIPKGGGAIVDKVIAKLIKRDGLESLNTIAKTGFRNTQKALALIKENKV